MGNVAREKPNISLESAQKSATFGVEFEFQSTSNGSLELPECSKISCDFEIIFSGLANVQAIGS